MPEQKQINKVNQDFNRQSVLEKEAKKLERKLKKLYREIQKEVERDMTFRLPNLNLPIWAY
jgi:predicted ATP-grasp superfamily ATP-dependent carboligase